ncbi:MAG: aldo/keto reductase [Chitinophagaceae bacterium]|nr:aldo/keto reductase [Chitinophagaceae bacterium]MCA6456865.1 aldo/keto reductase [Chitinophagaceae bacterium]MCA6459276.1 aldo/keto reductase [Chitinophagaceae bacterium]MCA6464646.1 aldo/keto reductase [Chitinophagaceae bacterium]MEA3427399.1 aldo/keto reductase [Bacteroidota bacterium]
MEYREIGQSGIHASAITFGAWAIGGWMWGGADRKEALEAILASYELGVTSIDTAPAYGQGLSEEIVGDALKTLPRDKVQILTKYGLRWDLSKGEFFFNSIDNGGNPIVVNRYSGKESIIEECENSLRRLGTDHIDLYQIHWADPTTPIEETMEAVLQLQQAGKIRAAGVCNYTVDQMKTAETVLPLASNQVPYSMVFRDIEKDVIPYCIEHQKAVIAYSPLQRGLLTGKIKPGHQFNEGDTREGNRFYSDENIRRINGFLDDLRSLAADKNASLAQLVIAWTLRQPGITLALVGARNAEQASQNARASNIQLSHEELQLINDKLGKLELVF